MNLGRRIEKLRKSRGESIAATAYAVNIKPHILRDLESGAIPKDLPTLLPQLAKHFEVSIHELLGIQRHGTALHTAKEIRSLANALVKKLAG